ncbi:MAG: hypothetical protein KatS3mg016_1498 [Fimbriimonadales bacterium]|nr:MAG: hypothetical protein KatS3mg016_1498 [Fimbriimonadales bacterium]
MRTVSGVLGVLTLTVSMYGQAFIHQKLGENFSEVGTGILSEEGLPFWSAELIAGNLDVFKITGNTNLTASILGSGRIANPIAYHPTAGLMWEGSGSALGASNTDVFVETTNLSASVLGTGRYAFGFKFTTTGQPVWYGSGSANSNQIDIFLGSSNLTASVLGSSRDAIPAALNANDHLLWDGAGTNLGVNRDVFRTNLTNLTTTNLSQSPLGNNRFAIAVALNSNNDATWYGAGSSNGDYNDVFFNSTNVSFPVIGGGNITNPRDAVAFDVSGNNLTWGGRSATTSQFYDSFATTIGGGTVNMSQSVLGNGRDSYPIDVEGASVLWNGIGANTNNYDVFVTRPGTTRNLSQLRFGGGSTPGVREGYGVAVFANGNAFWMGKHSTTNAKAHLFHYNWTNNSSTNLVQEAVNRDADAIYLAHNSAEQVLWAVPDSAGTRYEVYLSTPNIATTLQGTVTIAGFVGDTAQIALTIRQFDPYTGSIAATHTGNMNSGGAYSIALTPGLYDGLRITAPRCLARNFPGLRRLLGATTLNFSLTLGDVNGDNVIDDADLLEVLFNFGSNSTDPVDLNGDGVVDDADLLIVLFNFGNQGD